MSTSSNIKKLSKSKIVIKLVLQVVAFQNKVSNFKNKKVKSYNMLQNEEKGKI